VVVVECRYWGGPTTDEEEEITRLLETYGVRFVVLCHTPWEKWRWLRGAKG
jgi:hypothetical protein